MARTRDQCRAHGQVCVMKNGYYEKMKTREACEACGGSWEFAYHWYGGQVIQGTMSPLSWRRREFTTLNRWEKRLNMYVLKDEAKKAVNEIFKTAYLTEAKCRFNRLMDVVGKILCDCSVFPNKVPEICNKMIDCTEIGEVDAMSKVVNKLEIAEMKIEIFNNTVDDEKDTIKILLGSCSMSRLSGFIKDTKIVKTSSAKIMTFNVFEENDPILFASNSKGYKVGVVVGDGMEWKGHLSQHGSRNQN
jgi:hypothetical protein